MLQGTIFINYNIDTNILKFHTKVINLFEHDRYTPLVKKLELLKRKRLFATNLEEKTLDLEIVEIEKKFSYLSDLEQKKTLYLEESKNIITEFKNSGGDRFDTKTEKTVLKDLLSRYIVILEKYVKVQVNYDQKKCKVCNSVCVCKNKKVRKDYEDEINFIKALNRFQGKQNKKINFPVIIKELDDYFKRYSKPVSDYIKKMPLNDDGYTRGNTSIAKLNEALIETKNTKLYEDINLLCHEYWGWELPNISEIYDTIISDYRITQAAYDRIEDKNRKSCLNLQYRIFKHLELRGFPVTKDNFKLPSTTDILKEHDLLWKIMCKESKLIFIPTI